MRTLGYLFGMEQSSLYPYFSGNAWCSPPLFCRDLVTQTGTETMAIFLLSHHNRLNLLSYRLNGSVPTTSLLTYKCGQLRCWPGAPNTPASSIVKDFILFLTVNKTFLWLKLNQLTFISFSGMTFNFGSYPVIPQILNLKVIAWRGVLSLFNRIMLPLHFPSGWVTL